MDGKLKGARGQACDVEEGIGNEGHEENGQPAPALDPSVDTEVDAALLEQRLPAQSHRVSHHLPKALTCPCSQTHG